MDAKTSSNYTDDIPRCRKTGVGTSSNETIMRHRLHPIEDRSFHFRVPGLSFFGVLDGFSGSEMSDFAARKMPADVCFAKIDSEATDETVKEVLKAAFESSDREYFETMNESLALALSRNHKASKIFSNFSGASATIGVTIEDSRLFIANAGDTGALLALKAQNAENEDYPINFLKLSIDHVLIENEDEDLRLRQLGLDPKLLRGGLGGPRDYTRCLGYHRAKSGTFREDEQLRNSRGVPVLSEPEIHGGIPINSDFLFLLLYSRPLIDTLAEVWGDDESEDFDKDLIRLVYDEFKINSTITGVAQSVVDKVVRMHKEKYEEVNVNRSREDITLLVRNFNCSLGSSDSLPRSKSRSSSAQENVTLKTLVTSRSATTTTTESSDVLSKQGIETLPVDKFGRILPYVDFSHYDKEWKEYEEYSRKTP